MKKDEREFLKKYEVSAEISHSYQELREQIEVPQSPRRRKIRWGYLAGAAASLALVLGIATPLAALPSDKLSEQAGNSHSQDQGGPLLELWEDVQTVRLADPRTVQRTYERNLSFVEDSISLSTQGPTGKTKVLSGEAIQVDASAFHEGEPGDYPIHVSSEEGSLTYEVEVIESEAVSLEASFLKGAYYDGEIPLPSDFLVDKVRDDGTKARATDSEIGLEYGAIDSSLGTAAITIYLKTNPSLSVRLEADVLPLCHIDLSGEYAYIDDYCSFGQPAVEAFSIKEGYFYPIYTEFVCNGKMSLSVEDGEVRMKLPGYNQGGTYDPEMRLLWIDGIAGDPPFACFLRPGGTVEVDASFVLDEGREETFLALGGYLTPGTLDYIKYLEGDCYLDEAHTLLVGEDTLFTERTRVYCHAEDEDIYDEVLEGIWVDERGSIPSVGWVFHEGGIAWGLGDSFDPMSVLRDGNTLLVRYGSFEVIRYDIATDMVLTYAEDETLTGSYRRIDEENEVIFTLTYGMNGRDDYVLERGEPLPSYEISPNGSSVSFLEADGYDGGPVTEDVSYHGSVGTRYLSDYWGRYGDHRNYWQIVSPRSLDLEVPTDTWNEYVFCIFEDYELVDYAPVRFDRYEDGALLGDLLFASGKEDVLRFDGGSVSFRGETRMEGRYPWENLLILGKYVSEDGKEIEIDKFAQISEIAHREDGSELHSATYVAWLKDYDEETGDGTILYSWTSLNGDEHELRECPVTREEDTMTILYDGVSYSRSLA